MLRCTLAGVAVWCPYTATRGAVLPHTPTFLHLQAMVERTKSVSDTLEFATLKARRLGSGGGGGRGLGLQPLSLQH